MRGGVAGFHGLRVLTAAAVTVLACLAHPLSGSAASPAAEVSAPQWEGVYDYRGTVNLRWFRVQSAVRYIVQRKVGEQDDFRELAQVTNPLFDDLATFPGKIVFYRILAVDASGRAGPPSEIRYLKVETEETEELRPPTWSSSMQRKEGIALSWTHDKPGGVLAYNVYRRRSPADPWTLITSSIDSTYLDKAVTPKFSYQYVVTAFSQTLQESDYSEVLKIVFTPPEVGARRDQMQKLLALEDVLTPTELVKTYAAAEFGFVSPVDLDWRPDKRFLYVSDVGTGLITVINDRDEVVLRLGGKGSSLWNFENLLGICVDEEGFVYGADAYKGEIVIFKPDGSFHKRVRLLEQVKDYFGKEFTARFPVFRFGLTDLVIAPDGALLVVDNPNGWIYVLDRAERLTRIIGEKGEGVGQFHYPTFLCLADATTVTVSDTLNSRLQEITVQGAPGKEIGKKGLGIGQLLRPKGLVRDDRGLLYVADSFLNAIQVFDRQGEFVAVLGDEKGKLLDLGLPNGLAFLGEDLLAVCEKIPRRVTVRRLALGSRTLFFTAPAGAPVEKRGTEMPK
jgi:DNA-binding beta-propeller fold protein YncE